MRQTDPAVGKQKQDQNAGHWLLTGTRVTSVPLDSGGQLQLLSNAQASLCPTPSPGCHHKQPLTRIACPCCTLLVSQGAKKHKSSAKLQTEQWAPEYHESNGCLIVECSFECPRGAAQFFACLFHTNNPRGQGLYFKLHFTFRKRRLGGGTHVGSHTAGKWQNWHKSTALGCRAHQWGTTPVFPNACSMEL